MLKREVAHLPGAEDEDGLVGERVEDVPGHIDGHARDRELAAVHPGLLADELADAEGVSEQVMEDRPDRFPGVGGLVGVADLAEDLPLAEDEAFEARRDAEQVADDRLVVVGDEVAGEVRAGRAWKSASQEESVSTSGSAAVIGRRVQLDAVAGREDDEFGRGMARFERVEAEVAAVALEGEGLADRGRAPIGGRRPGSGASSAPPPGASGGAVRGGQEPVDADPAEREERGGEDRQEHHRSPPHLVPEAGVQQEREDQPGGDGDEDLRVRPRQRPAVDPRLRRHQADADRQAEREQRERDRDRRPVPAARSVPGSAG